MGGTGRSLTKPGTLLKQQIPIKTFAAWDETAPGFLEMDLVAHGGQSGAGEFLFTLSAVDVATGWISLVGVRNKGEQAVFAALEQLRAALPFPLRGLDSDNGGEFINKNLYRSCLAEQITLTRGRPYHKNDGCPIEQKNWRVVRRHVGYARFEGVLALGALNRVYALAQPYTNQLPAARAHAPEQDARRGSPHQTLRPGSDPYQRLQHSGVLSPATAQTLATAYASLHPIQLKLALEDAQQALYHHALQSDPLLRHPAPSGRIPL